MTPIRFKRFKTYSTGDFASSTNDPVYHDKEMGWIGCCHELNAACVPYGAGELKVQVTGLTAGATPMDRETAKGPEGQDALFFRTQYSI